MIESALKKRIFAVTELAGREPIGAFFQRWHSAFRLRTQIPIADLVIGGAYSSQIIRAETSRVKQHH